MGIVDWRVAQCDEARRRIAHQRVRGAAEIELGRPGRRRRRHRRRTRISGFSLDGDDLATTSWDILTGARETRRARCSSMTTTARIPASASRSSPRAAGAKVEYRDARALAGARRRRDQLSPYLRAFSAIRRRRDAQSPAGAHSPRRQSTGRRRSSTNMAPSGSRRRPIRSSSNTAPKPADELYFELKPGSRNLGEVDHAALIARTAAGGRGATLTGAYQLSASATRSPLATSTPRSMMRCA